MSKEHVYIVGVVLLGLMYQPLKAVLTNKPVFFAVVVLYLIADRIGKP